MEATFTKVGDEGGEEIELATVGLDDDGDERDGVALFAAAGGHKRSDGGGADALGAAREGGDGDGAAADEDDALAPLDEEGVRALLWGRSNFGFLLQYLAVSRGLGSRDSSRRVGRLLGKFEIGPRGSPPFVAPRESPPPAMLPRRCPHCCAHTAAQTAAQTAAHTCCAQVGLLYGGINALLYGVFGGYLNVEGCVRPRRIVCTRSVWSTRVPTRARE